MNWPSSTGPRARAREHELEGLTCRFGVCPWLQRNRSLEVPASAKKTAIGADMACEEYNIPAPQISMLAWDDGRSLARMAVFFADESIRRSRRSNIELWGRGGACCVGAKSRWLFFRRHRTRYFMFSVSGADGFLTRGPLMVCAGSTANPGRGSCIACFCVGQ